MPDSWPLNWDNTESWDTPDYNWDGVRITSIQIVSRTVQGITDFSRTVLAPADISRTVQGILEVSRGIVVPL